MSNEVLDLRIYLKNLPNFSTRILAKLIGMTTIAVRMNLKGLCAFTQTNKDFKSVAKQRF
ncbi:MAG: hypothetical protein AUK48_06760 [Oscillatoriales cyanobacterium CG2_30_44_21]|nr:MAG: hypothetical protein AUK48_06760 [Oscillatoriales cyanobacterium CG2_30_44_21]